MRLLHTADWQIGMKAANLGAAAGRVRAARLETARDVVRLASERGAEMLILAGDTFEDNGVSRAIVEETASILTACACPVYVLPGNHDPLSTGSVWEHPVWESAGMVRVFREAVPVQAGPATLYPCPLRGRWSNEDPAAWISGAAAAGGLRIGIAHGTLQSPRGAPPDVERAHPIQPLDGLDYFALGHWHSTAIHDRAAYSGTPEPTRFGERESGNVLIVDLRPDAPPRIEAVRTARLEWVSIEGDLAAAARQLERIAEPGATLVDCRLTGFLSAGEQSLLSRVQRTLSGSFLHFRLDASALLPAPDDDAWFAQLPPGYLREAAARLRTAGGETATRALLELYGLLPR
ncbi:MAG: metallophosphoesterase [Bryobacteraceae bacterium]